MPAERCKHNEIHGSGLTEAGVAAARAYTCPFCHIETMEERLKAINLVACYVTEEATEERHAGLIEIGKLARGEPCAFTCYIASAEGQSK